MRAWGAILIGVSVVGIGAGIYTATESGFAGIIFVIVPALVALIGGISLLLAAQSKATPTHPHSGSPSAASPAPRAASLPQSHA